LLLDEGVHDHFVGGVANAFVQHGRRSLSMAALLQIMARSTAGAEGANQIRPSGKVHRFPDRGDLPA